MQNCDHKSRIPLLMKVLSGNEEEGKSYGNFIEDHIEQLQNVHNLKLVVVDSKLYNQGNLSILKTKGSLKWLTRVPNTLKAVKELLVFSDKSQFQVLWDNKDYSYLELCSNYGGVNQRWIAFHSENKYKTELKQFTKRIEKQTKQEIKWYKKLSKEEFKHKKEALQAANSLSKNLKYSNLDKIKIVTKKYYESVGKPNQGQKPTRIVYRFEATICSDTVLIEQEKNKLGYFILATNELNGEFMPAHKVLKHYKNQAAVERGFRFLKGPNIVGASLFVQKPQRMMALIMVMTLCLLVYSALEFKTRTLLKQLNLTFNNHAGKPIQNPTMKWIFQCFEGIHVLYLPLNKPIILNLNKQHRIILDLLGKNYSHFYS